MSQNVIFSSRTISLEQSKRIVTAYELDFNPNSEHTMMVDDKVHAIKKNSIVFRQPGNLQKARAYTACICFV